MDYQKIYNSIIDRAKNRQLEGYGENHHIIPRCLGGSDDKENLVKLTAREHFLCHWILTRVFPENKKLIFAFYAMTVFTNNTLQKRYTPSSRVVEEAKRKVSQIKTGQTLEEKVGVERAKKIKEHLSNINKGRVPWNKGVSPKPETIQKFSSKMKGRLGTFKNRKHKESSKDLMRLAKLGKYSGKDSPCYGKGKQIKEHSTGFIGTISECMEKFNIKNNASIYTNISRGIPFQIGKNKGLHFTEYTHPCS